MEQQANQPIKQKSRVLPVVIAVFVSLAVVGGIAYEAYNQKKEEFDRKEADYLEQLADLREKSTDLEAEKAATAARIEEINQQLLDLASRLTASGTASSTATTTPDTTATSSEPR